MVKITHCIFDMDGKYSDLKDCVKDNLFLWRGCRFIIGIKYYFNRNKFFSLGYMYEKSNICIVTKFRLSLFYLFVNF